MRIIIILINILLFALIFAFLSLCFVGRVPAQDEFFVTSIAIEPSELCAFRQCNGDTEIRHCDSPHALCADHNQDGCVSATDALMVLNEAVGICEVPCNTLGE